MIVRIDIKAIEPLADGAAFGDVGAYERVIAIAKGEVDPDAPGNRGIALIDKAPRNAAGKVEYATDIYILRPKDPAKGNGRARPAADGAKPIGRAKRTGPSKNAVKRAAELEREVERAEAALRALEDELADPSAWASPTSSERATKRHAAAKKAVEEAYARWEAGSTP